LWAVFCNGGLAPNLELAQHTMLKGKTYSDYVESGAPRAHRREKKNRRVRKMIEAVDSLLHHDVPYLGGGHPVDVDGVLPDRVPRDATVCPAEPQLSHGLE